MKIKQTLRNIGIGLGIGLVSLSPVKAEEYTITPETNLYEFFKDVRDATVYVEAGIYPHPDLSVIEVNNVDIIGITPLDFLTDNLEVDGTYRYITGDYAVIENRMRLNEGSSFRDIIRNGNMPLTSAATLISGNNVSIENCLIQNSGNSVFLDEDGFIQGVKNVRITGNTFLNNTSGVFYGNTEDSTSENVVVKDNKFIRNRRGVISFGYFNMGDETYEGNNLFWMNRECNIYNESNRTLPAKYNWWYPTTDFVKQNPEFSLDDLLSLEDDIQGNIKNVTSNKSTNTYESWVDVVPFHEEDFFEQQQYEQPMSNDNWSKYE